MAVKKKKDRSSNHGSPFFKENVIFLLVSASPLLITELMLGGGITTKILERLYNATYNTGVNCFVFICPIYYFGAF